MPISPIQEDKSGEDNVSQEWITEENDQILTPKNIDVGIEKSLEEVIIQET